MARIEELLEQVVADAIAQGLSEEDVSLKLGTLAREEYRKQQDRR